MVMSIDKGKIVWGLIALCISITAGFFAFKNPVHFSKSVEMIATVMSILIGVSLAVSTVLMSKSAVSTNDDDDRARREARVEENASNQLLHGQYFVFLLYFASLILAVTIKYLSNFGFEIDGDASQIPFHFTVLVCIFVTTSTFALLWSCVLPSLLRDISIQRSSS